MYNETRIPAIIADWRLVTTTIDAYSHSLRQIRERVEKNYHGKRCPNEIVRLANADTTISRALKQAKLDLSEVDRAISKARDEFKARLLQLINREEATALYNALNASEITFHFEEVELGECVGITTQDRDAYHIVHVFGPLIVPLFHPVYGEQVDVFLAYQNGDQFEEERLPELVEKVA